VDRQLYVERWLLSVKAAAIAAGLAAHVRALDFKGGKFLAFEVRQENEALEIRYLKRWTGAGMVAAATGAAITQRVREVFQQQLKAHARLLQSGLRRFLRRSIHLLTALESAFLPDSDLPRRVDAALREVGGVSGARPAAVVRKRPGVLVKYEVLPAVAFREGPAIHFAGLSRGKLVDLSDLIKTTPPKEEDRPPPGQETGFRTVLIPPALAAAVGVELLAQAPQAPPAAASAGGGSGGPNALDAAGDVADVASHAACALSDASCPGDCGGCDVGNVDCSSVDFASVDCGGAPDCSF
jgi:hypothetical protein